jgi:hypothetical protein
VIEGSAKLSQHKHDDLWHETVNSTALEDIVLAGAASHPQYPSDLPFNEVEDEEYLFYQKLANQEGFSLDNPSTFFIQHVYCSTASRNIA